MHTINAGRCVPHATDLVKEFEQKYGKAKNDNDVFLAVRQQGQVSLP